MSNPLLAFVSDLHLSPRIYRSIPEMVGDSYAAWNEVVEVILYNKPPIVILGGDIFDTTPDPVTLDKFSAGVQKLNVAGIAVYAIQGQHGRDWNMPWTSVGQCTVTDLNMMFNFPDKAGSPTGVTVKDKFIAGFDNGQPEEVREKLALLKKHPPDILCLHQMCRKIVPEFSGHQTWDIDPEWVPAGVKLVLLGDYHVPEEYVKANADGTSTRFIYNGSTVSKSVSEPDDKSLIFVNEDLSIQRAHLSRYRKTVRILLDRPITPAELQPVLDGIKSEPPGTLFYVKYDMRIESLEGKARGVGPGKFFLFKPNLCIDNIVKDDDMPKDVSLAGCLDQVCSREVDPEFFDFLMTLLKDEQPINALAMYRNKVMNGEVIKDPVAVPAMEVTDFNGDCPF